MVWILATIFGAICSGCFALPMKFTSKWKWENIWGVWAVWTLLILPWVIGFATIPNLLQVYHQASWASLLVVFVFGFMWGFGAITFGMGLYYLGMGLAYSLIVGLNIAVGSLLPLLSMPAPDILKANVLTMVIGVGVIIIGVVINGRSAVLKEKDLAAADSDKPAGRKSLIKGVIICVISGIMNPMLNYAFIYGDKLMQTATMMGVSKTMAANSIWVVALFGGFLVNASYCALLATKNRTWGLHTMQGTRRYYLYALIMGVLWAGSIAVYGMAITNMGKLGPSVGWAIFMSASIFVANMLGIVTGEWKGAAKTTLRIMAAGLIVLLIGICVVGWANTL
jgi:L-rhamnose-H+ transport protein